MSRIFSCPIAESCCLFILFYFSILIVFILFLQVRGSTTTTTHFLMTMPPASLAASWTWPLASSTSCATWAWRRTARGCPGRWSRPGHSAQETGATAVAKSAPPRLEKKLKEEAPQSFDISHSPMIKANFARALTTFLLSLALSFGLRQWRHLLFYTLPL